MPQRPDAVLDLSSACRKLSRALVHLEQLGDAFEAMGRQAAGNLTLADEELRPHPQGSRHLFLIGELVQPPGEVGPIVGDYVQNLRAALDHLAWEMVQKGRATSYSPTAVQFPIYSVGRSRQSGRKRGTFADNAPRNLPGIDRHQLALVRRHQPFHRGKWHLAALAALSNRDKHRIITPTHLFATDLRRRHFRATTGRILRWRLLLPQGRPVTERTAFLEVIADRPDARVELLVTITTRVAFEERPGRYVQTNGLVEIGSRVAETIEEAARRWGTAADERVCADWPDRARSPLGMSLLR